MAFASSLRFFWPENAGKNLGCSTMAPTRPITASMANGTSWSKIRMWPESAAMSPRSIRSVVVFPEPLGPRNP
jgi:hypothetical protein